MSSRLKITQFRKTISTSGVPVQLNTSPLSTHAITIIADPDNTGTVYVGDDSVSAASKIGVPVPAGDDVELAATQYEGTNELIEVSFIHVDSTSSGDEVIVTYFEREGTD